MTVLELLGFIVCIVGGFLLGGVMFSQLLPQWIQHKDIQAISEDHNPGATNVFVNCGVKLGIICLILDFSKGLIPVVLAGHFLDRDNLLFGVVLAAPVLGHAIAPFHHFHGGKCIATAFGEMVGLLPYNRVGIVLAVVYVLFSTVLPIHPNRIRSLISFGIFGLISAVLLTHTGKYSIALGCVLISLTAIVKHSKYFAR